MRVIIADDALLIREGLAKVLTGCGIDVVAQAGNVADLLAAVDEHSPDVAIVDIRMPPRFSVEGLRAAEQLEVTHPELAVLILSQYREPAFAAALLANASEGRGYLLKERIVHHDQLIGALYRIAAGQTVVDPAVIDAAMDGVAVRSRLSGLSPRELEVLQVSPIGGYATGWSSRRGPLPVTSSTSSPSLRYRAATTTTAGSALSSPT